MEEGTAAVLDLTVYSSSPWYNLVNDIGVVTDDRMRARWRWKEQEPGRIPSIIIEGHASDTLAQKAIIIFGVWGRGDSPLFNYQRVEERILIMVGKKLIMDGEQRSL